LPPQRRNLKLETEESIRDILVGCGLQETISYSLTTVENHDKVMRVPLGSGEEHVPFIKLLNPLSTRRNVMRSDMLVSALDNPAYTATCAWIKLQGGSLGIMGEVDPQVLHNFDLPAEVRVYAAQMHINPLVKPGWQLQPVSTISNYPPVVEDLAFVVSEEVTAAKLLEAIRKGGGTLLTRVELFDTYRGQQIPPGYKSLAYNLTYEIIEKPLTENQVVDIRNRIIRRVAESVGGKLRE